MTHLVPSGDKPFCEELAKGPEANYPDFQLAFIALLLSHPMLIIKRLCRVDSEDLDAWLMRGDQFSPGREMAVSKHVQVPTSPRGLRCGRSARPDSVTDLRPAADTVRIEHEATHNTGLGWLVEVEHAFACPTILSWRTNILVQSQYAIVSGADVQELFHSSEHKKATSLLRTVISRTIVRCWGKTIDAVHFVPFYASTRTSFK